nr:AAA-associated domain-containing protein [Pseudomonas sp. 21LCFQ010]
MSRPDGQCRGRIALVNFILDRLHLEPGASLARTVVLGRLAEWMDEEQAERVLNVAIEWGRYSELFEYSFHNHCFTLTS